MGKLAILLVPYYSTYYEGVERPYCLNYSNSNGELAATRFTYDKKGLNTMGFYQEISGQRSSKNFHSFDGAGRILTKSRVYNDGETSIEKFHYDEEGILREEFFESSNGPTGSARYEYDGEGKAIMIICSGYKGWLKGVIEFKFDRRGKRVAGRILTEGTTAGSITYQYATGGNLLQEHWDIAGSWSQTFQYVYEETL